MKSKRVVFILCTCGLLLFIIWLRSRYRPGTNPIKWMKRQSAQQWLVRFYLIIRNFELWGFQYNTPLLFEYPWATGFDTSNAIWVLLNLLLKEIAPLPALSPVAPEIKVEERNRNKTIPQRTLINTCMPEIDEEHYKTSAKRKK